jgi:hypothetical protein
MKPNAQFTNEYQYLGLGISFIHDIPLEKIGEILELTKGSKPLTRSTIFNHLNDNEKEFFDEKWNRD